MKVIGYVRVSTEEQASQGVSLQAQEEKIRQYAALYDLDLVDVIHDAGASAKSLKRPGLQQALSLLDGGQAEGLVIAKLDRLTRSVKDWNTLIDGYFSKRHALLSVADQIDTRTAAGRLVLNVLVSVAQWEREAIGERTSAALQYKKSQGEKLGAPSLGDAEGETETLVYVRDLRAQGLTLTAITARLNAEGIKTKRGGKWYAGTVKYLLDNVIPYRLGEAAA
jgi:DNA invertase Pin-like site-specific DNA recombinase